MANKAQLIETVAEKDRFDKKDATVAVDAVLVQFKIFLKRAIRFN